MCFSHDEQTLQKTSKTHRWNNEKNSIEKIPNTLNLKSKENYSKEKSLYNVFTLIKDNHLVAVKKMGVVLVNMFLMISLQVDDLNNEYLALVLYEGKYRSIKKFPLDICKSKCNVFNKQTSPVMFAFSNAPRIIS